MSNVAGAVLSREDPVHGDVRSSIRVLPWLPSGPEICALVETYGSAPDIAPEEAGTMSGSVIDDRLEQTTADPLAAHLRDGDHPTDAPGVRRVRSPRWALGTNGGCAEWVAIGRGGDEVARVRAVVGAGEVVQRSVRHQKLFVCEEAWSRSALPARCGSPQGSKMMRWLARRKAFRATAKQAARMTHYGTGPSPAPRSGEFFA